MPMNGSKKREQRKEGFRREKRRKLGQKEEKLGKKNGENGQASQRLNQLFLASRLLLLIASVFR